MKDDIEFFNLKEVKDKINEKHFAEEELLIDLQRIEEKAEEIMRKQHSLYEMIPSATRKQRIINELIERQRNSK